MIGAVVAAALALAGAPAASHVACDATLAGQGVAYPEQGSAFLAPDACGGILVSAMTPRERNRTQDLNVEMLGAVQGRGLLVLLHEARHLSGELNECRTERFAVSHVGVLIRRFVPLGDRESATVAARQTDAGMPADYHAGCDGP